MDRSTKSLIVFFLIAFGIPWIGWTLVMTAIYNHTKKSIFFAVIFHWLINMMPYAVLNMYEGITFENILYYMIVGYGIVSIVLILLMGKDLKWRPKTEAI